MTPSVDPMETSGIKIMDEDKKEEGEVNPCGCSRTKCLKLYCECFRNNKFCVDCKCRNCKNKPEHSELRERASELNIVNKNSKGEYSIV